MFETLLIQCSQAELIAALKKALSEELSKVQSVPSSLDSELLFTKKEAAAFLKVSLPTFSKHIKASKIPCYRLAQTLRFKKSDLLKSLKQVSYTRRQKWNDSS